MMGKGSRTANGRRGFWASWRGGLVGIGIVAVIAGSFVLPGAFDAKSSSPRAKHGMAAGVGQGGGLPAGSPVPAFSEHDLLTGRPITSETLRGRKTLLFFSEGVMCQACFEQIRGLQQFGAALESRDIQLVSITPDGPSDLRQAMQQYGVTTSMISDADRSMSVAFNTLGKGMHADTPGHAFALIERGEVRWYRDYWLTPYRTMYVEPARVLADLPTP